jgi:hypothetical protein
VQNPFQVMRGSAMCIGQVEAETDFEAFKKATQEEPSRKV